MTLTASIASGVMILRMSPSRTRNGMRILAPVSVSGGSAKPTQISPGCAAGSVRRTISGQSCCCQRANACNAFAEICAEADDAAAARCQPEADSQTRLCRSSMACRHRLRDRISQLAAAALEAAPAAPVHRIGLRDCLRQLRRQVAVPDRFNAAHAQIIFGARREYRIILRQFGQ